MFQSEQLQEKWAPLLDYEGLDPIKDSHRRAVTSVLLENQEKFLKEDSNLVESVYVDVNAGELGGLFIVEASCESKDIFLVRHS